MFIPLFYAVNIVAQLYVYLDCVDFWYGKRAKQNHIFRQQNRYRLRVKAGMEFDLENSLQIQRVHLTNCEQSDLNGNIFHRESKKKHEIH